ncbi:checkpoint protein HUS1 isoform X2 [Harmonia axyridis]|nr:checkpoint protein HUS1 isoform X2 [Harmonia axyridis]XP_045479826.1 checkpoint protein HUS1 isoform X2 [Harmonia axyridis]XP_045479832.1 checkpoint protein HUS1 isoform X2 [Harmonia axyridis]
MRITTKNVYFIVSEEESGPRRPLVWCDLPVNFYFKEYNVVGVSEEYNEIYLEFSTALLARSVSVLKQNVKNLKIKLTNKEFPCLTLEMELVPEDIQSRQCVHDIRVEVISRKHWSNYEEPRFNDFHVTISMPPLKHLKNIVERMKNISHQLIVSANKNGRLILQIKTNTVTISSHFPELSIESFAVGLNSNMDDINTINEDGELQVVSSTIDIKKFLMFLTGMQLNNCKALCSIVHERMVKLYMEQPGAMKLQIFLTELND